MTDVAPQAKRCFSAIVWSREEAAPLYALREAVRAMQAEAPLCWTEPSDLHLTLRFYGHVDEPKRLRLTGDLKTLAASTPPSNLVFLRLETWPPIRPRVLVARFRVEPSLTRLQAAVERAAREAGLAPEPRQYQAHVTLARAAQGWNGRLTRTQLAALDLPASEIALWHNNLRGEVQEYVEAWRQPFGRPLGDT